MNNIARLGVILGLNTAEFTTGVQGAKRQTKELEAAFAQLKIGALAVGTAVAAAAVKTAEFADEIADTADAYGTTIEKVLDLSEALAQSGGKSENAGRMFGQFANKVDDAANAGKQAQESFARIGISLKDLKDLSMDELFGKALENISKIEDPVKRNAAAFDVFGKAVRGVDLSKLSDQMLHGAGATDSQVASVRRLADAFDEFHAIIFRTKLVMAEVFGNALNTAEVNFRGFGDVVVAMVDIIAKSFEGLAFGIGATIEVVKMGAAAISNIIRAANPFGPSLADLNAATGKQFLENIKQLATPPQGGSGGSNTSFGGRDVKAAKDSEADKQREMMNTAKLISVEYERQLKFAQQQLQVRESMVGMTEDERRIQETVNGVLDLTSRKIDEIRKQQENAAGRGASKEVVAQYEAQIDMVRSMGDEYANQMRRIEETSIQAQRTFSFGWEQAFRQYAENAYNNATLAASMFNTFTNAMNQGIATFVQTGKLQFRDFVKSVLQGLLQIQLQMLAMRLITSAVNFASGWMSTTPGTSLNPAYAGPPSPFPAKAAGGSVTADTPYLVGERGPELFMPSRSGTIIPNGQMAGAMSGAPQAVYNGPYIAQMNAIDTQSAVQFLAKNKMAVYSANMSASRSLPTSTR